jgi:hypothetical protein
MKKKIMKDKLLSVSLFLGLIAAGGFVVTMFSTIHFQATAKASIYRQA